MVARPAGVLLLGVVLSVVAGCGGSPANKAGGQRARPPIVLAMADHESRERDLLEFVDAVGRLSNGSMRIAVRGPWRQYEIDYETGIVADVRAGRVAMGIVGVRSLDTLGVRTFEALLAPFLVDSLQLEERALEDPRVRTMLAGARKLGVVPVAVLPGEIRRPFGRSRRLVAPADYQGAVIGIRPSRVAAMTFDALGGRARGYVPGDLRGFDGAELDLTTLDTNESYDTRGTSLTTNVNLWPRVLVVVVNRAVYHRLTSAQRAILRDAGVAAIAPAIARLQSEEDQAAQSLCSRARLSFLTASPDELAALRARVQPVYDELGHDPQTSKFLHAIAALKKGVEPQRAPSCAKTGPRPAKPAPLDGVYRMTVTKEQELRNDGVSPAHAIAENYGTFVWVVSHGRFAQTQKSDHACTWTYGTVKLRGETLEQRFIAAGGVAPNNMNNKPTDLFVWRWSLYRETLRLTAVSPTDLPTATWRRVSSSPARRYFSRDCPPPSTALAG